MMNRVIGWRYRRYFKRPKRDRFWYSVTVSVSMSPIPRFVKFPEAPWWIECERRQTSYGVSVSVPRIRPIQSFTDLVLNNVPWPQSCWIQNMRTKNNEFMQASKTAKMVEYARTHHARAQTPTKGTTVAAISKLLRYLQGWRYSDNTRAQSRAFLFSNTASLPSVLYFIAIRLTARAAIKFSLMLQQVRSHAGVLVQSNVALTHLKHLKDTCICCFDC